MYYQSWDQGNKKAAKVELEGKQLEEHFATNQANWQQVMMM